MGGRGDTDGGGRGNTSGRDREDTGLGPVEGRGNAGGGLHGDPGKGPAAPPLPGGLSSLPLIINTCGWVQGLGLQLLAEIVISARPSTILALQKENGGVEHWGTLSPYAAHGSRASSLPLDLILPPDGPPPH
eukprot:scaffold29167_cov51-Isochrysis_galbana.AAC.1